jgi:hypothetical protein
MFDMERSTPDIAQTSAGLVSPLTLSAAPLVDLSPDKLTMPLRQWPGGRINDGSAYRPLFLHSPRRLRRLVTRCAMGAIRYLRPEGTTRVGKKRFRRRSGWLVSASMERRLKLFSIVVNGMSDGHCLGCFPAIEADKTGFEGFNGNLAIPNRP